MDTPQRPLHVFLIHTHLDRSLVHRLYARFARDGIRAWLDAARLMPGQDWRLEIRKAILRSDLALVFLSRRFNRHNGYCQEELRIALKKASLLPRGEVFLIPVRLERCQMPEPLGRWQRVDLFEADGYSRLLQSLYHHAEDRGGTGL